MTLLLARVPALRLLRTPRSWFPIAAWALVGIVIALVSRGTASGTGANHMMRGSYAFLILPLVSFAVVGGTLGRSGLRRGIGGVVALGAPPRTAALASVGVAVVISAALGGLLGAMVCGLAHGAQDPPLAGDIVTSLWVGVLGGAAYGAYFSLGSAIGKGAMRGVFLALDWIIGSGAGVGAFFTPRGHVEALLGGPLVAEVSSRVSSVMLVVLAALFVAGAVGLMRRA